MEKPNNGKKTMGRRKIEIKKIEKKTSLQVAFTKRRGSLFRKASELAVLCGAEVAILVQSPAEKLFAFGHPSVGALINRVAPSPEAASSSQGQIVRRCDSGRLEYERAMKMLEMENRRATEKELGGFWWEEPYEGLELHELEEFLKALEDFGEKVAERVMEFEKLKNSAPPLIHELAASSPSSMHALITPDNLEDEDLIFPTYSFDQIFQN